MKRQRKTDNPVRRVCILFLKLIFVWPVKLMAKIVRSVLNIRYNIDIHKYPEDNEWIDDEDNEQEIQDELNKYDNLPEIPEMCQVFPLGDNTCIGVEYVSMCPDETVHIRIIGDTTFSQIYKRRVYIENDSRGRRRYFKLNNTKYYLDDRRTKPLDPIQSKKGK